MQPGGMWGVSLAFILTSVTTSDGWINQSWTCKTQTKGVHVKQGPLTLNDVFSALHSLSDMSKLAVKMCRRGKTQVSRDENLIRQG